MRALASIASLCLLAVAACSSPSSHSDDATGTVADQCGAVADALCTHVFGDCQTTSTTPIRDQCTRLGTTYCKVDAACSSVDESTCLTTFIAGCCGNNGTCDQPNAGGQAGIDACDSALASLTCSDISLQTTPTVCKGVVHPAATGSTISECRSQGVTACCGTHGTCGEDARSPDSTIDACVQAIQSSSCTDLQDLPGVCHGAILMSAPMHLESSGAHASIAAQIGSKSPFEGASR